MSSEKKRRGRRLGRRTIRRVGLLVFDSVVLGADFNLSGPGKSHKFGAQAHQYAVQAHDRLNETVRSEVLDTCHPLVQ
ncbi:LOW QUALITY PROTEIN: hypothetical protein HID58_055107 [Brassica napus]|uniref:Uncharacterized protein n=1 Tax=Brassica napus TaxID=3708 RepID=A0ABQ8AJR4_BRANA|nr:LOW QUALITY PROTEIN: hypothetical protein HID58_055107 [Brassica napus]